MLLTYLPNIKYNNTFYFKYSSIRAFFQGEEVAIKKIFRNGINSKELERDFWKEVNIMKQMRHPKIVLFMGISKTEEHYYIMTEYMAKKSLDDVLKDENIHLSTQKRMKMATDISKALCFLHSCNPPILHRDLKTGNCLCD